MRLQKVVLTYTFTRNGWYQASFQPYGVLEPVEEYGEIEEQYDYTTNVDSDDLYKYLIIKVIGYNTFKTWSEEKQQGFKRAIELLWEEDFICELEYYDDFLEWLKEEREYDAKQEYEEENEND